MIKVVFPCNGFVLCVDKSYYWERLQEFTLYSYMSWSAIHPLTLMNTAQKMKFSIKDFFSTCDKIRRFLWIWSHLLKKSLMENFIFCVVEEPLWEERLNSFFETQYYNIHKDHERQCEVLRNGVKKL